MIKFSVNYITGTVTVNNEGVKMFHDNVMLSNQVASILAGDNAYSARELNLRLNSGEDFAIAVPEERFNKLNYGYGICDGRNVKIVMYYNLKFHLCFLTYINGHVTTICVQDGDVFSETPLKTESNPAPKMDSKEYRSKLFSRANQIRKEEGCSQKDAFRRAKEEFDINNVNKSDSYAQPNDRPIYNKDENDDENISYEETVEVVKEFLKDIFGLNEPAKKNELKSETNSNAQDDSSDFLAMQFKKLGKLLNELNTIEGELNEFFNKRQHEKPVNPNPESMDPVNVLLKTLTDLMKGAKK